MGGRLSLTMHGASVGSWASPQNPRSRLQGTCPAPRRNLLCRQSVSRRDERVRGFAEIAAPRMNLSAGYRD